MFDKQELNKYINLLFESTIETDPEKTRVEINSMRNTQPPKEPTFVLGQEKIKNKIKEKINMSIESGFSQIIITGDVGDGKTHFLNCVQTHFFKNDNFFSISSKVEEGSTVGHNFVRLVLNRLFKKYYNEFCDILVKIGNEFNGEASEQEAINKFSSKKDIEQKVSLLLFNYNKKEKLKYNALNVIRANYHSTDLAKLKINKLSTNEYVDLLRLILQYGKPLIVILDEFEHVYTLLTPAAKRKFLSSYKYLFDQFASAKIPITLVTAVTEQSEGWFRKGTEREDKALWTRIQDHVEYIERFNISNNEIFKELFTELAERYKYAYNYDVGLGGAIDMRKRIYDYWGDSTATTRGNREIISTMIKIMDDLRSAKNKLNSKQLNEQIEYEQQTDKHIKQYNLSIADAETSWERSHHNAKPGLIKTGLERLLKHYKLNLIDSTKDIIIFKDIEDIKLVYVATGTNLRNRLEKCKDKRIEIKNKYNDKPVFTYFLYTKTEDIRTYLRQNPDITPIPLDSIELYNIISFSSDENLVYFYLDRLDKILSKIGLKEVS